MQDEWRIDGRWLIAGDLRVPIISGGAGEGDEGTAGAEGGEGDTPGAEGGEGGGTNTPDPLVAARAEAERERADRLRLEGENKALREAATRPPAEESRPLTREDVESQFAAGQITEAQRIDLIADLRVQSTLATRDAQEAANRPRALAADRLDTYLTKYPDLNVPGSDLLAKVTAEMRDLATMGLDPQDVRTQLIATERVVGGHQLGGGMNGREFNRGKIPTGGAGGGTGGGAGGPGVKKDPLAHVPKAQIEYWKTRGYTKEQMEAEAPFVTPRPARGFI